MGYKDPRLSIKRAEEGGRRCGQEVQGYEGHDVDFQGMAGGCNEGEEG